MSQFIRGIPRELDEAAMIDGAGPIRIYWSVILPLLTPALVTTAVFTFIWTYEDFLPPLVFLTSMEQYTVPQGLPVPGVDRSLRLWTDVRHVDPRSEEHPSELQSLMRTSQ